MSFVVGCILKKLNLSSNHLVLHSHALELSSWQMGDGEGKAAR